ncbi:MAG: DUF2029 domain-containing protein [Ardenticatenaceae bacterium]|nr:DUF2029 domain-containing protein [Ardenticatenaceae bacterium]
MFLLFVFLLLIYLAIAYFIHWPAGYYGSLEQPRFADPWIARTETILSGGLLYRDVFTTTPPLTNFLLIPPAYLAGKLGHVNPWATLSFMLYFSLFNYFGALVLLYMGETRREGFLTAVFFLLNPLTFGNTILRRQDESVVVFFIGVALLLFLKRKHLSAAVSMGLAVLVKLTGGIVLPIAFLHSRKWHYLVIPAVVFFTAVSPFLILAGRAAMFWDFSQQEGEHPFQFGGVSLVALWNQFHEGTQLVGLEMPSILFVLGVGAVLLFIAWKRIGVVEDLTILIAVILLLTPKLHTGYFSMLAFSMAPLLKKYRLFWIYYLFGGLAIIADYYKWPIENFPIAFYLMVAVVVLLIIAVIKIIWQGLRQERPLFVLNPEAS